MYIFVLSNMGIIIIIIIIIISSLCNHKERRSEVAKNFKYLDYEISYDNEMVFNKTSHIFSNTGNSKQRF